MNDAYGLSWRRAGSCSGFHVLALASIVQEPCFSSMSRLMKYNGFLGWVRITTDAGLKGDGLSSSAVFDRLRLVSAVYAHRMEWRV